MTRSVLWVGTLALRARRLARKVLRRGPHSTEVLLRALGCALMATAWLSTGCRGDSPRLVARPIAPVVTEQLRGSPRGKLPEDKRRFREPGVYIDGNLVGVLRVNELPRTLAVRMDT